MALTASDKKEIETLIKKEVKDFIGSNTMKQYDDKIINIMAKELRRCKLETEAKEIVIRVFTEFYEYMWTQRSTWSPRLRRA